MTTKLDAATAYGKDFPALQQEFGYLPAPPDPLSRPAPAPLTSHGAHLLVPIALAADGSRVAACPVCLSAAALPPGGGWVVVRCGSCGTEFAATAFVFTARSL